MFGAIVNKEVALDPKVIAFETLRYLTVLHIGFDGLIHTGELIVHEQVAEEVLHIFKVLYEIRFPIEKMRLISYYGNCDELSMAANNSSAFNFRYTTNGKKLSQHAYGLAIDLNPVVNPFIEGDSVLPINGLRYVDRNQCVPGMIKRNDSVYYLFKHYDWIWGGDWQNIKDYHHFEKSFHRKRN